MVRPSRLPLPAEVTEEARDLLCRAQAALQDGHQAGVVRHLLCYYDRIVPRVDALLAAPVSCGAGLLGVYRELWDIDVEREPVVSVLLQAAARLDPGEFTQGQGDRAGIAQKLEQEPLPRPSWWRRFLRGSAGSLGDRARVFVQRGTTVVLERLPSGPQAGFSDGENPLEVDLGPLASGDRLTLQVQMPRPGQLAVLHALSGSEEGPVELELLFPQTPLEEAPKRALEVVEVVGELCEMAERPLRSFVVLYADEEESPSWIHRALVAQKLPPFSRAFRYRYQLGYSSG